MGKTFGALHHRWRRATESCRLTVVTLDGLHSGAELDRGIGKEGRERAESVSFNTKRKSPQVMSAIVKNDQIIFITRH